MLVAGCWMIGAGSQPALRVMERKMPASSGSAAILAAQNWSMCCCSGVRSGDQVRTSSRRVLLVLSRTFSRAAAGRVSCSQAATSWDCSYLSSAVM